MYSFLCFIFLPPICVWVFLSLCIYLPRYLFRYLNRVTKYLSFYVCIYQISVCLCICVIHIFICPLSLSPYYLFITHLFIYKYIYICVYNPLSSICIPIFLFHLHTRLSALQTLAPVSFTQHILETCKNHPVLFFDYGIVFNISQGCSVIPLEFLLSLFHCAF